MQPLERSLRSRLERTIREAREIAEVASWAALEHLCVNRFAPLPHLSQEARELRRRLRLHGRHLGDSLNGAVDQTMERLLEEVAYEHWHRMLFARFLAENNLLIYDGVSVTLDECGELAAGRGLKNAWELAAALASEMLPQIFRAGSVVFEVPFSAEYQGKLERLVADLPKEVFHASDALGWVYQFWQAKRKDEINASEVKIGDRELSAVTQLFTEPYMVNFLLDNSLGAWWAVRRLSETDLKETNTEAELRTKAAISGVPLESLRFVKENGTWTPASGSFPSWPEHLKNLKVLDPCCGSGHFLVALLLMLVPMRMEMEEMSSREAVDAVLAQNLHGLELDRRCVELAAFALALSAWRYPGAGGYRPLPEIHIACSGLALAAKKEEWLELAGVNGSLKMVLHDLYDQFKNAPVLGSLITPESENLKGIFRPDTGDFLTKVLASEQDNELYELGVVAQGVAKASSILSSRYHLIVTNVPYLSRGKQTLVLKNFCENTYPEAKGDLATVFLERCLNLCTEGGTTSIVLPHNWLFLTTYKKFREKLLKSNTWHLIARLGPGAFETISGEVVKAILIILSRGNLSKAQTLSENEGTEHLIRGLDVSGLKKAVEKASGILTAGIKEVSQEGQLKNPDATIVFKERSNLSLFGNYANCSQGIGTSDISRFVFRFWEIKKSCGEWDYYFMAPDGSSDFSGFHSVLRWENGQGVLAHLKSARVCGQPSWGKKGIGVAVTRGLNFSIYLGPKFDCTVAVLTPKNEKHLAEIIAFLIDPCFSEEVRKVDQALSVTESSFLKVPFDLNRWTAVAAEKYPNGLPNPYSNDPTQWIFHGHPCGSVEWDEEKKRTVSGKLRIDETVLQVAVARLLGYRWPAELDSWMELATEQRDWVKQSETLLPLSSSGGVVCILPVCGEPGASDRLLNLLAAAYGNAWTNDILLQLLSVSDNAGKSLERWFRDKFFLQHCRLFHHRPFIWQIWDGLNDGFSALLNYHQLDFKKLEALTYTYLGDWISRQRQNVAQKVEGAVEKLAAAEGLKKKLELILQGEKPYDIFVRWKPIEKEPIGWHPDINDGVRLNIRPFMTAGVLRFNKKPQVNIAWDTDRGTDVESAPWFKTFKGKRINDHHLSLEEKRMAREEITRKDDAQ